MDPSIRIRLGKKMRELRKKRGFTQEKLATLAEVDYKYLQRIEGKNPYRFFPDAVVQE